MKCLAFVVLAVAVSLAPAIVVGQVPAPPAEEGPLMPGPALPGPMLSSPGYPSSVPMIAGPAAGSAVTSTTPIFSPPLNSGPIAGTISGSQPAPPPPPVFRTCDIVRADLLHGKNYRLTEYSPLVDGKFHFEIETPWGVIPAQGMAMLELRLRELPAIEYGSRIAEKNPQFVEGIVQVAEKTPVGAYYLVTDPVQSLRYMASGLKRIATSDFSPGGRRANCEARRRIACLLCCDPETHNPVLDALLCEMSTSGCVGWLGADAVLNFGLPGLGDLAANAEFRKMCAMRSTREIQAELDSQLNELQIPESSRHRRAQLLSVSGPPALDF